MSSGVIGAQYGSTKAQNLFGVSFFGNAGLEFSATGRICSLASGSKAGTFASVFNFGSPMTFVVSAGIPWKLFNFFADLESFPGMTRLPGEPGACLKHYF